MPSQSVLQLSPNVKTVNPQPAGKALAGIIIFATYTHMMYMDDEDVRAQDDETLDETDEFVDEDEEEAY